MSDEGLGHHSLCCSSNLASFYVKTMASFYVKSAQTGHSTYHIFAQGCPQLGLPGNYQMLLWLCREARSLRGELLIAFWPWEAVLDKLLYNHCTIQPAEQHCNIFLLSSCSFGGSYLISFIHVNVSKNAAASACRMAPIVPFVRASGLFLRLLSPFLQRDKLHGQKVSLQLDLKYELSYGKGRGHIFLNMTAFCHPEVSVGKGTLSSHGGFAAFNFNQDLLTRAHCKLL